MLTIKRQATSQTRVSKKAKHTDILTTSLQAENIHFCCLGQPTFLCQQTKNSNIGSCKHLLAGVGQSCRWAHCDCRAGKGPFRLCEQECERSDSHFSYCVTEYSIQPVCSLPKWRKHGAFSVRCLGELDAVCTGVNTQQ